MKIQHKEYSQYYNTFVWTDETTLINGGHFIIYIIVKSLFCTPQANIILYINYT